MYISQGYSDSWSKYFVNAHIYAHGWFLSLLHSIHMFDHISITGNQAYDYYDVIQKTLVNQQQTSIGLHLFRHQMMRKMPRSLPCKLLEYYF